MGLPHQVQLNLRVLAKSTGFHGRQSAAALIGIFFCHVNQQSKVELKEILVNLTYDESILVQLKAGDALIDVVENTSLAALKQAISVPDVALSCQHNTFIYVFIYLPFQTPFILYKKDNILKVIKTQRLCGIYSGLKLRKLEDIIIYILTPFFFVVIQKTLKLMTRQSDVKEAVKLFEEALCDPSRFCRVDDAYAKSLIIPALLKLYIDPNYDIREQSLKTISNCLEYNDDQIELEVLLSDNYKKKTVCEDRLRKLNSDELQILMESVLRSCTSAGGDSGTRSKLRLKVAEMMSRLVKALPKEYCEKSLIPLQITWVTNIENTSEAVEPILHCTSFYRKFKLTSLQHQLIDIIFDIKQTDKGTINNSSAGGASLNIHNSWRIRCALCKHLSVMARLSIRMTDRPYIHCEYCIANSFYV